MSWTKQCGHTNDTASRTRTYLCSQFPGRVAVGAPAGPDDRGGHGRTLLCKFAVLVRLILLG
jgi:hypothetical protein